MSNSSCIYCQGRGAFRGPDGRWKRCRCKKRLPTSTRALMSKLEQLELDLDPERKARAEHYQQQMRRS